MSRVMTYVDKAVHDFLYQRDAETFAATMKNRGRDSLREYIMDEEHDDVRIDESGHRYLDLPDPLTFSGVTYTAICAQRRLSSSIDLDKTETLARELGLFDAVFPIVEVREFDEDALYAANQRGLVSDEQLDSLISEQETYAIVPVKL
jgi:hypothetical protein